MCDIYLMVDNSDSKQATTFPFGIRKVTGLH